MVHANSAGTLFWVTNAETSVVNGIQPQTLARTHAPAIHVQPVYPAQNVQAPVATGMLRQALVIDPALRSAVLHVKVKLNAQQQTVTGWVIVLHTAHVWMQSQCL